MGRSVKRESQALGQAWISLSEDLDRLEIHKQELKEDWQELERRRERLRRNRERFEGKVKQEWFPEWHKEIEEEEEEGKTREEHGNGRIIRLNIGGQMFEVSSTLLLKERFSLLAATAVPEEESVLRPDEDGCFFFDRDWYLFRHILGYLRDGILPDKPAALRDLYHEASFYCLWKMQRSIKNVLEKYRKGE